MLVALRVVFPQENTPELQIICSSVKSCSSFEETKLYSSKEYAKKNAPLFKCLNVFYSTEINSLEQKVMEKNNRKGL